MNVRTLTLALACVATLPAARALACSPRSCSTTFLFPASGSVPANMVRLSFLAGRDWSAGLDAGVASARLYRLEGDTRVSVPFTTTSEIDRSVWIEPMESQPEGARLVLEADQGPCDDAPFRAELTVTAPVPLPTELGTLAAQTKREVLQVLTRKGSCSEQLDVSYADLSLQLSAGAAPYAGLFRHQLIVDGMEHAAFSTSLADGEFRPQGEHRIYADCSGQPGRIDVGEGDLSEGKHRVKFTSKLPDGTTLSTPELEIELRCDGAAPTWPADASPPPRRRDASVPDASVGSGFDASVTMDVEPAAVSASDDGCAMATRRDGAWLLALALVLLRRRRHAHMRTR